MRKVAAIGLLIVFWFNLFGYQFLFSLLEQKADKNLELLIDNNEYNDAELLELRVSLNMPYQQRFTEYERHYGQITIEGKTYHYVKRKIEGDVLVLKCIPNDSKDQLKDLAVNITRSNSNSDNSPVKSSVKVFSFECDEALCLHTALNIPASPETFFSYTDPTSESFLAAPYQPPKDQVLL